MKSLIILLLIPLLSISQVSDNDKEILDAVASNSKTLSTNRYKTGLELSLRLLKKYPNDSTVIISHTRFLDAYVRKSKCTPYLVPKDPDLCNSALQFYKTAQAETNNPRITLAQGRVHYFLATKLNKPEASGKAKTYFNKAIESGAFADFEIQAIKRYLMNL